MEEIQFLVDLAGFAETVWAIGGAGVAMLGTLLFGRRYKQRIAKLEAKLQQPTVVNNFYGNMETVVLGSDGLHRMPFDGKGELVSPVPIEVHTEERIGIKEEHKSD